MKLECIRGSFVGKGRKYLVKHLCSPVFLPLWIALVISTILCFGWSTTSTSRAFACSLSTSASPFDFGDQTFELDHTMLHFTNGLYESSDRQHIASITERSINQANTKATAILLDNPPGSGVFSYVVGAIRTDGVVRYSEPVFLGDRIKVETVSISEGTVTIHYLAHSANAPLATEPTKPVIAIYTFQADGNLRAVQ